jgi:hypothetical protein
MYTVPIPSLHADIAPDATNIALNINLWPFLFWLYFLVPYYLLIGYLGGANMPEIVGSGIIISFPFLWVPWAWFSFWLIGRYDRLESSSSPIRRRMAIINRPTGSGQGQSTIVRLWLNQTYPIPARTGSEVSVRVVSRWRIYARSFRNVLTCITHQNIMGFADLITSFHTHPCPLFQECTSTRDL